MMLLFAEFFSKTKPDEFYHLAGQSHVGISFEIPEVTTQEIANCTLKLLEICRDQDNPPKVYLACSSEIFGNSSDSAQNENSPLTPLLLMGWQKLSVCTRVISYRESYQLFVCNGIFYNHESPRRGENFVTQKIVRGAASIAKGKLDTIGTWKSRYRKRLGICSRLCSGYVVNAPARNSFRLCISDRHYP